VAFLFEALNVISERFAWLLLAARHIPWVTMTHVCTLEVADEDLLEV
jgi:hypothetical protein